MIVTILEGRVASEHWETLKQSFESASQELPSAIRESYLIQAEADEQLWRVLTVWHSREALREYRKSVETPGGVVMFREAGVEPALSLFEVKVHAPE